MDWQKLIFDVHVKFVERKIAYAVGILKKLNFPQVNSTATLSCTNLSSPSLCDSHMGFYKSFPQNFCHILLSCLNKHKFIANLNETLIKFYVYYDNAENRAKLFKTVDNQLENTIFCTDHKT